MKKYIIISIALCNALYSYTTNIIGDLANRGEVTQSGTSNITANNVDNKILAKIVVNGTLTTKSDDTNKLIFDYTQANLVHGGIVVKTGGNFIDFGSKFYGQGLGLVSDNMNTIKIDGGVATLNNSSVFAGNGESSTYQYAPAILVEKGTLNLKNSLVQGGAQKYDETGLYLHHHQAIDAVGFGSDKTIVNISGSTIKSGEDDITALAIRAKDNSMVNIDDTLANKGTNIVGYIISSGDFTIKGIYKNQATFNAKDILSNINITNNNIFDTTINASVKTNLEKNANIDKAYIGGGLDLNKSAKSLGTFNITNSYIAKDIVNAHDVTIVNNLTPAGKSSVVLDNVYLEGFLTNYSGDIKSSNSVFNKTIISKYVSKIDDTNSIFKGGFSADEIFLNGSILEGFKKPTTSDAKYSGKNFTLTNTKVGKDLDNTKGYLELMGGGVLKATNSAINYDIRSDKAINVDLSGSSLVGSFKDLAGNKISANTLKLANSTTLGAFSVNELVANNSTFFLGGTSSTYDGAIISKTSTSGMNNSFGILGVVNKGSDGKLIASGLSANMPLAILKGANESFIKDMRFYSGISEYALANSYLKSQKIGDYLVYVLAKDNSLNFDELDYKNGTKLDISKINEIINDPNKLKDLVDFSGDILASNEAKELINQDANKSLENTGTMVNDLDGVKNPDTKPENPDTSIPWEDLTPANPINPDTKPDNPDTKPENPDTSIPWEDLTPANPINPDTKPENPDTKPDNPDTKPENPDISPPKEGDVAKVEEIIKDYENELILMSKGKNEKALNSAKTMKNQFYYSHVFEYNNLNKRLGELRNTESNIAGFWVRNYINQAKAGEVKMTSQEVQLGFDKLLYTDNLDIYTGIMFNIGDNKSNDNEKFSIENYGGGLYFSVISHYGTFIDLTAKFNHYKSEFKNDTFLGDSKSSGTGFLASIELGHRFGYDYYVEPSIELIVNYIPATNIIGEKSVKIGTAEQSYTTKIKSKSTTMLVGKSALYTGVKYDYFGFRLGVGGVFDFKNQPSFSVSDATNSYTFSDNKKDSRGFVELGMNGIITERLGYSLSYEKGFGGKFNIEHSLNGTIRAEF